MQNIRSEWGAVAAFVTLATLPVVGLAVATSAKGGLASLPAAVPLAMLAPGLAAIIVQKATGGHMFGTGGLGLRMGRIGWWFAGLLGIGALCLVTFVVTAIIDPVAMADAAELRAAIFRLQGVPEFTSPVVRAVAALVLTALVAPFLNFPLLLGEELGWRGFLTPRLVALIGRPGILVAGAIWALWHLPIILLGYNYGAQPWAGLLIWVPLCMALSVLLTALVDRGGSIWPAVLGHGALNQLAHLLTATVIVEARFTPLIDGAAGAAGLLVFAATATIVYRRRGAVSKPARGVRGAAAPAL
jgi:membrane protease YdiL (CAAX protease family)